MSALCRCLAHFNARQADSGDADFLRCLYRSTRDDLLLAPLDAAALDALIDMQQRIQAAGQRSSFPGAEHLILHHGSAPVARVVVDAAPGVAEMRLVDIAVLAQWRRRGIGGAVLRALQRCAAERQLALALTVAHANHGARRLYLAAGFEAAADDEAAQQAGRQAGEQLIYRP